MFILSVRELKKTTLVTASGTSLNKRFNEQYCYNRFLAWESTSVKTWGDSLVAGNSSGSDTGGYPQRSSEFRSIDFVQSKNTTNTGKCYPVSH